MENAEVKQEQIRETGSLDLEQGEGKHKIRLLTIIGEIEGHESVAGSTKATKYEHLLPMLAEIEDSDEIEGLLILLNTLGGDIEAGLSIAEMIASLSKPTVSLGAGRKPFHRRAFGCGGKIFLYRTKRHHDHPSCALKWNVYRCGAEPAEHDPYTGSDYPISCCSLQNFTKAS